MKKARVIRECPQISFLKEGEIVELIPIPYPEDTLLVFGKIAFVTEGRTNVIFGWDGENYPNTKHLKNVKNYSLTEIENGRWVEIQAPVIAKKGSMKELHVKLANGDTYNASIFYNSTGKSISHFLERIN